MTADKAGAAGDQATHRLGLALDNADVRITEAPTRNCPPIRRGDIVWVLAKWGGCEQAPIEGANAIYCKDLCSAVLELNGVAPGEIQVGVKLRRAIRTQVAMAVVRTAEALGADALHIDLHSSSPDLLY